MIYEKEFNKIVIWTKEEFCPKHIFECGQTFSYKKVGSDYVCYPLNKIAKIVEKENCYEVLTNEVDFFENYFDLKTNYAQVKKNLKMFPELEEPIKNGFGIRILRQDLYESIISFILSANNNIKRITASLNKIREKLGDELEEGFFSFPNLEKLCSVDEVFFKNVGAGYRAKYLVETSKQLNEFLKLFSIENTSCFSTKELLYELLKLKGVGRKVAECILLFGYARTDVFPVDTWIKKVYLDLFGSKTSSSKISELLIERYGKLSGYAQQYLFYNKRENS